MKNVIIKIKGTQIYDNDKDSTEFTTEGRLEKGENFIRLYYNESEEIGEKGVKAELKISDGKRMELIRSGEKVGGLTVEKGKRHTCLYNTPYGAFMVGVYGEAVTVSKAQDNIKIYLSYTLDVNSGLLSRNIMEIEIKNINS